MLTKMVEKRRAKRMKTFMNQKPRCMRAPNLVVPIVHSLCSTRAEGISGARENDARVDVQIDVIEQRVEATA